MLNWIWRTLWSQAASLPVDEGDKHEPFSINKRKRSEDCVFSEMQKMTGSLEVLFTSLENNQRLENEPKCNPLKGFAIGVFVSANVPLFG